MGHFKILVGATVLLAAGLALVIAADSTVVDAIGIAFAGFAGVALVSLVFLIVGESEDRDREQHPGG
ncbi:MAG TPA: hypothetical protein VGM91_23680 [Conexibacter sp.]|jgi:hypothetical protein